MKTIGLLGGMSWESTEGYYRAINEGVRQALGGLHSAKIVMHSVDFEPVERLQREGDLKRVVEILIKAARSIEAGGADFLLICTNTMHRYAKQVERAINIPLLHIADATADVLLSQGVNSVGLLGTAYTMELEFYKGRLENKFALQVLVPDALERAFVHRVIYEELCVGKLHQDSKEKYLEIINNLDKAGAEAVILGCTEIGLLIDQQDTQMRLVDTTLIHSQKAVECALS